MKLLKSALAVAAIIAAGAYARARAEGSAIREMTLVNYEMKGTKIWLPATLIVKKGETVKLHLMNTASANHGFAIDEFGVKAEVTPAGKKDVTFTADKAGLFRIYCQMHAAHITGELLVLE